MEQAEAGNNLTLTDGSMTRFFFTIQEGVALIDHALFSASLSPDYDYYGETFSSEMCAVSLKDFFNTVANKFNVEVDIIGRRPGEKTHEHLLADYELKDSHRILARREPWYATDTWLDLYMTVPHSENYPDKGCEFGVKEVFSSDTAPRLVRAEIWDILKFAYDNTWKD